MNTRLRTFSMIAGLSAFLASHATLTASPLFQFGPSDTYTDRQAAFVDRNGRAMEWGPKRLFSERTPLTPPSVSPAIFGGYELYNVSGPGIFIDYKGVPTTGVNNNTFAGKTLDTIGVEVGLAASEQPRDASFALAFLALGQLERPAAGVGELNITSRLSYRMLGSVPGSIRAVVRAGGRFYASDHAVELRATSDRSVQIPASALSSATWRLYDPRETVAFDSEAPVSSPVGPVDFAGVLVTRVVNVAGVKYADFHTLEIAELVIERGQVRR
jgi:hypothetical protein